MRRHDDAKNDPSRNSFRDERPGMNEIEVVTGDGDEIHWTCQATMIWMCFFVLGVHPGCLKHHPEWSKLFDVPFRDLLILRSNLEVRVANLKHL